MASLEELRFARLQKKALLEQSGMSPYATQVERTHTTNEALEQFDILSSQHSIITVVGRVMALRGQGAIIFFNVKDGSGVIQCCIKKDEISELLMSLFVDTVDIGDFVQVSGTMFETKTGQRTILITDWMMLTKTLRPLPDKWHGLQDVEETYRKRYLDALMDDSVHNRFVIRTKVIKAIRAFFDDLGFLEIETPILQTQAGGAMARVFETFHNDYQIPMVLRIALELDHKILTAAGYERIYEIGKSFRNEGSDPTHIQEFTMMEWYAAYASLDENLDWTEALLRHLAQDIIGKTTFSVFDKEGNEHTVYFDGAWTRVKFADLLKEYADFDMNTSTLDDIRDKAIELGLDTNEALKTGKGNLLDYIFKKTARPKLIQPTFVLDYPSDLKPLAQQNIDGTARVAQLVIAGAEITNQYAELVDPILERNLLEEQTSAKEGGDDEAMSVDERFLTAMEHGMPPMTGFGMGIDRLVALFTEQRNLRDVIFFPIMKPKSDE